MPLDILCPSCRSSFPVTNAGASFHVECPSCDAAIGVSVEHPDAHKIGTVPRASAALTTSPAATVPPSEKARPEDDEADAPERGKSRSFGWVVLLGTVFGLLLVVAGVGATGYVLFTNLDTDDTPTQRKTASVRLTPAPSTPYTPPPPFVVPPPPVPVPVPKPVPAPKPKPEDTSIVIPKAPVTPIPMTPMEGLGTSARTIDLPGPVNLARVGGGGRYLVLTFKNSYKMVVYDLCTGKVTAEKTLDAAPMTFAVGMNKLVTVVPGRRVLQHFKFPDLEQDGESPFPLQQDPAGVAMGSGTNGPLLVAGYSEIALVDPESRSVVPYSTKRVNQTMQFGNEFWASHDGALFATSNHSWFQTFKVVESQWEVNRHTNWFPLPLLGPDGDSVYGDGQLMTLSGGANGPRGGLGVRLVPATHGPYYLKVVDSRIGLKAAAKKNSKGELTVSVYKRGDATTAVADLGAPEELQAGGGVLSGQFGGPDRQLFLVPGAKVLAVIPPTRDKLVLRRVNLE
jgi:hypothetical protein